MGGSPKIDGGMTYAEQKKLQEEEREFQATQERERRAAAEAAEQRRVKREAEERERIKMMEERAVTESTLAEEEARMEGMAQKSKEEEDEEIKTVDFYSNLYKGINL